MKSFQKVMLVDIIEDAKKNDRIADLKQIAAKPCKGGKSISFIELKRDYYKKFYPEMIPVASKTKKTMIDIINEL